MRALVLVNILLCDLPKSVARALSLWFTSHMTTQTWFLAADTTPARYAELTGLTQGRGFVVENGRPVGLYPDAMARRIMQQVGDAGINHHPVAAANYNEGRRKLAYLPPR